MTVISNGTNLINNGALDSGVPVGKMTLLATQTASGSSTISFTSGINSTYDTYEFRFINIHPATNGAGFGFQVDTGTNTNYNHTVTSTAFRAYNLEGGGDSGVSYVTGEDQQQDTGLIKLTAGGTIGADNDQSGNGTLTIYAPSDTTFVKHFIARSSASHGGDYATDFHKAGYVNQTAALTRVQFKMTSGNIDSGIIKLYGIGG